MTHDLVGVVAEICEDVLVMYGGKIAERTSVHIIHNESLCLLIQRLLQASPNGASYALILCSLPLDALSPGCRFEPRNHRKREIHGMESPPSFAEMILSKGRLDSVRSRQGQRMMKWQTSLRSENDGKKPPCGTP